MKQGTATDSLAKRHAVLFYSFLFVVGVIIAGLATLDISKNSTIQEVYSATMSSVAAALMVATVLFAIRYWFMIGSNDIFLRRTGMVEGSEGTGIIRVFDRMENFGTAGDWHSLLNSAREHVDIMGRTAYGWFSNNPDIDQLITRQITSKGIRFRWLIMGPGNPYLPTLIERDRSIGSMLQRKILDTTKRLREIRSRLPEQYQGYLEIKHFSGTPLYFSLVRIDYRILVTHYQSSKESKSCPMSQLYGLDSTWGESHMAEFEELWADSRDVSVADSHLSGPGLQLDQRMLRELQEQHHVASQRVIDESRADFPDFNRGWRVLFSELIESAPLLTASSLGGAEDRPILRDFTLSAHGGLGCQCWNLLRYPQMLKFNFQDAVERDYEARFLIICEKAGEQNSSAELFLLEVLRFVYRPIEESHASFPELFEQWKESSNANSFRLKVRLSCVSIVEQLEGLSYSRHPYNVYGDMCVSRSILRVPQDPSFPSPHLEVLWGKETVRQHQEIFDKIWEGSLAHQEKVFGTSNEDLARLGDGSLFDMWSMGDEVPAAEAQAGPR